MLVERVNRYINKGLKIMTNERESIRVALEAILLLITPGTLAPFRGQTFLEALLLSDANLPFPSITWQVNIGS